MRKFWGVLVAIMWTNAAFQLASRIDWHLLWTEFAKPNGYQFYTLLGVLACLGCLLETIERTFWQNRT